MTQGYRRAVTAVLLLLAGGSCARKEQSTPAAAARPLPVEQADVENRARRPGAGPSVIWLGLDGLDWELVDRLAAEGRMPNWRQLAAEGWTGRLAATSPLLSPILWTTEATGVPPDVHRVLDFQEVDPASGRKVPISGASRAVPAVWNVASAAGKKVGVVGWWATHPAEEVKGFFVSDRASPLLFERTSLAGVVFPAALENGIGQVIARDGAVAEEEIVRFVDVPPSETAKVLAGRNDGGRSQHPVAGLARILGATRVSHRIARDLYDRERPELLLLYLEGTDEIGHLFASYAPPKLACVSDADFSRYRRAVEEYYALVDRIIGQWMRRARDDGATLLISSDHGFKWGADRPCGFASGSWATAAFWHRPEGVVAAWGARVVRSTRRGAARVADLAPTVLALLELPADRRMTGAPLADAFRGIGPIAREDVFPRIVVRRVSAQTASPEESDEYVRKLIALGYLSPSDTRPLAPSGGDRPGMTEGAWNNLGVYFRDSRGDSRSARQAFEKSLALRPEYYSALFNMAVLERMGGDEKAATQWLFRSVIALGGDPAPAVVQWARDAEKRGDERGARAVLEKGLHSYPQNEEIARALAMSLYRSRDCKPGVGALSRFEAATTNPSTLNVLALLQTCLENRAEVVRLLRRSLELKPDQPEVQRSLRAAEGLK